MWNRNNKKEKKEKTEAPIMGRPRKEFEMEIFEKLCGMMAAEEEIAHFFNMSVDTLNARCKEYYDGKTFTEVYNIYSSAGKMSIRREQMKACMKGDYHMLIWMGKQKLGQTDKVQQKMEINFDGNISVADKYRKFAERILSRNRGISPS